MRSHTVYGIYEQGSDVALYVGATFLPLSLRFTGHLADGKKTLLYGKRGAGETTILKAEWMSRHLTGEVVLEIRAISKHRTRRMSLTKEKEAIAKLKPILNSKARNTRKSRGMDVLRGERVPAWYTKHLAVCESEGLKPIRVQRFDAVIERLKNEPNQAA